MHILIILILFFLRIMIILQQANIHHWYSTLIFLGQLLLLIHHYLSMSSWEIRLFLPWDFSEEGVDRMLFIELSNTFVIFKAPTAPCVPPPNRLLYVTVSLCWPSPMNIDRLVSLPSPPALAKPKPPVKLVDELTAVPLVPAPPNPPPPSYPSNFDPTIAA
jgi:hypothetical protein